MLDNNREKVLAEIFEHLTAPAGQIPNIETIRESVENYGRGETGKGLQLCKQTKAVIEGVNAVWLTPPTIEQNSKLLYVHGGGWCAGSLSSHISLAAEFAYRSKREVLIPEYALAPEAPFPAGLDDVSVCFQYIKENNSTGPSQLGAVAIVGDSAGANLAAAYTIKAISEGLAIPDELIMLSGYLNVSSKSMNFNDAAINDPIVIEAGVGISAMAYGVDEHSVNPLVSPDQVSEAIIAKFPKTLLQTSGAEVLRDQSIAFSKKLWNAGVYAKLSVWPDMPHVWHVFVTSLKEADEALNEIANFLK